MGVNVLFLSLLRTLVHAAVWLCPGPEVLLLSLASWPWLRAKVLLYSILLFAYFLFFSVRKDAHGLCKLLLNSQEDALPTFTVISEIFSDCIKAHADGPD